MTCCLQLLTGETQDRHCDREGCHWPASDMHNTLSLTWSAGAICAVHEMGRQENPPARDGLWIGLLENDCPQFYIIEGCKTM